MELRLVVSVMVVVVAASPQVASAAPAPAAHYAVMFEKGHTFRYRLAETIYEPVEQHGHTKWVKTPQPPVTSTCTVDEVATFATAIVSKITCDEDLDASVMTTVQGVWAATRKGLVRLGMRDTALPTSAPDLSDTELTVAAKPKVGKHEVKTAIDGVVVTTVTKPRKGKWCVEVDSLEDGTGDGADDIACFTEGVGLVRSDFQLLTAFPYDRVLTLVTK